MKEGGGERKAERQMVTEREEEIDRYRESDTYQLNPPNYIVTYFPNGMASFKIMNVFPINKVWMCLDVSTCKVL